MKLKKIKALFLTFTFILTSTVPVFADTNVSRIAGKDRYETALKTTQKFFNKANGNLGVLVSGNDFKGALYASQLANALNVPYFVNEKHGIKTSTLNEMARLGIKTIYVIGDYEYLDKSIDNTLLSRQIKIKRVINNMKDHYYEDIPGFVDITIFNTLWNDDAKGDISNAILINDNKFPDLLSVIPFTSLLARKYKMSLYPFRYNEEYPIKDGYGFIIGGSDSIPPDYVSLHSDEFLLGLVKETWIDEEGNYGECYSGRLAGGDRYQTAVEIAKAYKPVLNKDINTAIIVNGENYADALSSGTVAMHTNGAILLTRSNKLNKNTKQYIQDNNIKNIIIVGGESSVSKDVENELRALN